MGQDQVDRGVGFTVWSESQAPMLHELIRTNRDSLVERARRKLAARAVPCKSEQEVDAAIGLLLGQLAEALHLAMSDPASYLAVSSRDELVASAAAYGTALLHQGLTLGQIVHYYGDTRLALTELAAELLIPIQPSELHTLNTCLDEAQAAAVSEYGRLREQEQLDAESHRLGRLAHELRNLLTSATLAYDVLKHSQAIGEGSAGTILGRSLKSLRGLIDRSLSDSCLCSGSGDGERRDAAPHPIRAN